MPHKEKTGSAGDAEQEPRFWLIMFRYFQLSARNIFDSWLRLFQKVFRCRHFSFQPASHWPEPSSPASPVLRPAAFVRFRRLRRPSSGQFREKTGFFAAIWKRCYFRHAAMCRAEPRPSAAAPSGTGAETRRHAHAWRLSPRFRRGARRT